MPTTTPHYTWLYTFTELTPVQCLAELRGLQSNFLIPIFAQANGALQLRGGGESGQNRLAFPSRKDGFLFRLAFLIEQENHHIENAPNPSPSFVEPCIVGDPNMPGDSLP